MHAGLNLCIFLEIYAPEMTDGQVDGSLMVYLLPASSWTHFVVVCLNVHRCDHRIILLKRSLQV